MIPHTACSVCGRWSSVPVCEVCQLVALVAEAVPWVKSIPEEGGVAFRMLDERCSEMESWLARAAAVVGSEGRGNTAPKVEEKP